MSAVGVDKIIFEKIFNIVRKIDLKTKRKDGRQNILDPENQVYLFFHNFFLGLTNIMIAQIFGISKSTVNNIIQKIQGIAKKVLSKRYTANQSPYFSSLIFGLFIFDCSEVRIERPKKDNKKYEYGRKKYPTMKSCLAICDETASIGPTNFTPGSVHDFKLFKDSYIPWLSEYATLIADLGFKGLQKLFLLPYKRSKLKNLTQEQKEYNQKISRKRSLVERVIGWLKRFKIISNRYRNNPKKFPEQFDLICAMFKLT